MQIGAELTLGGAELTELVHRPKLKGKTIIHRFNKITDLCIIIIIYLQCRRNVVIHINTGSNLQIRRITISDKPFKGFREMVKVLRTALFLKYFITVLHFNRQMSNFALLNLNLITAEFK